MINSSLKEGLYETLSSFIDTRIEAVFRPMRDDPKSEYSKFIEQSNSLYKKIITVLETLGPEQRKMIQDFDSAHASIECIAYDEIYKQAFLDGLRCKNIDVLWEEVFKR